ncbi:MAG: class I SAM-dependent methyltransferase [Geobacter sp.]
MQQLFAVYAATSPAPLPSTSLVITPEVRHQSELYLPIDQIRRLFYHYYRVSLRHSPLLASTPFHEALSWADCFSQLPQWCQCSADPARLLQRLLNDAELHERFIYASFLPSRYNGPGFERYPAQRSWLESWFVETDHQDATSVYCLDAACGSGEGSWELAELASVSGWQPQQVQIAGWTLDPLEVYAATNRYLPHLPQRQTVYRQRTCSLVVQGWHHQLRFQAVDLLSDDWPAGCFDLIICNGLLGGPMLHEAATLQRVVAGLAGRLRPGGWLLAADHFHGGWHTQVGSAQLVDRFRRSGLVVEQVGEGIAGRRKG